MRWNFDQRLPRFLRLTVHLVIFCMIGGCSKKSATTNSSSLPPISQAERTTPVVGDWLTRNLEAEPQTLNPVTASDAYESMINEGIYEGLITRDKETLQFKPQLAESFTISPDKRVYTFRLRAGVLWHDGQPLTVQDVKFTFDRIKDPKVDAASLRTYFDEISGCEIVDAHTVRFITRRPYFKTLETLGFAIIPQHIFGKGEDFNAHPAGRAPIGTGAYRFLHWQTGREIVLERNANYWGFAHGQHAWPTRIVFKILPESNVTLQLLKRGDIDCYDRVSPLQWKRQLDAPGVESRIQKFTYDFPGYNYVGWNLRRPIFLDVRVRKALAMLMDRDRIIERVYLGLAQKTTGPFLPQDPCYNKDVAAIPFDPVAARALLDQAGWRDTNGDGVRDRDGHPFAFDYLIPAGSDRAEQIGLIFQEELARSGIRLRIAKLEWAVFLKRMKRWEFDAVALSWALSLDMDPYQIWHGSQAKLTDSSNSIGYANPEADRLMEAARGEFNSVRRYALYRQLHAIIAADAPVIFLTVPKALLAVNARWQNIQLYPVRPSYDVSEWFVPAGWRKYP